MDRIVEQEWLDYDLGTREEIEESLRTVSRVNRWFGGNRLHTRLLRTALAATPGAAPAHILEVACGHAEVLQAALLRLAQPVTVSLLDRSAHHLPELSTWPTQLPTPQLLVGDALELAMPDDSVDIVSCCLFLHHLSPEEVMRFVAEACRVARVALVINDLERSRMNVRLAEIFCRIDPSRLSRHDGPASARAAYTAAELQAMLTETGRRFELSRHFLYRLGAIVWK